METREKDEAFEKHLHTSNTNCLQKEKEELFIST